MASTTPSVRLVRVPDAAPPYDCEAHRPGCRHERSPGPAPAGAVPFLVPAPGGTLPGPGPAPAAALPRQLARVIVEILAGLRPPRQLIALTSDRARAQAGRLAPLLACDRRPAIRRIVASRPAPRVVEMTVIVSVGSRSRAVALRFEHEAGRAAGPGRPARPARWLCTAIEGG